MDRQKRRTTGEVAGNQNDANCTEIGMGVGEQRKAKDIACPRKGVHVIS
jgi:hypothetical protein